MKPNQNPDNDEHLRTVLREWVMETPPPPLFQHQVWQRIERDQARPASKFWAQWARLLEVALPQPQIAFSYVAGLLVLGVVAGSVSAQIKTSRMDSHLGARYVQSVDPYFAESSLP
jgi:hypothetical protein